MTLEDDEALIEAILQIGVSLKLKIVAEGVETREQLNFLREKNCDFIQGYLFSNLASSEAFSNLLSDTPWMGQNIVPIAKT